MTASWAGFLSARNFNAVSERKHQRRFKNGRKKEGSRAAQARGKEETLQEPLQFGAVHVDVLHQLDVVDVHVVLRAHRQLLQPVETKHTSHICSVCVRRSPHIHLSVRKMGRTPGGDAAENSVEVVAAQREEDGRG